MTKFLTLLKIFWKTSFRLQQSGDKSKAKKSQIFIYIILAIVFVPMLITIAVGVYMLGANCAAEDTSKILTLLLLICQSVVLVFSLFLLLSNIFLPKDSNQLLPLPVNTATLFAAKTAVVYLNELLTAAIMAFFVILPFGLGASLGITFYIMLPLALLLLPILPMILGCLVAFPVAWLVRILKNKTVLKIIVQTLLIVALIGLYLLFIVSITDTAGSSLEDPTDLAKILQDFAKSVSGIITYIYPVSMIATALTASGAGSFLLNLLGAVLSNAAIFGMLLAIVAPTYRKSLSSQLETGSTKKGKIQLGQVKSQGVLTQLVTTDIKRVLRNNQLSLQAILGTLISPLLVLVFAIIFENTGIEEVDGASSIWDVFQVDQPLYQVIASVVIFGYMLFMGSSVNVLGMYPITRERQSVFVLRALPVTTGKILLSKVIVATLFMLVGNILTVILCTAFLHLKWYMSVVILIALCLYQFGIMCITTYLDVKSPILNWTNFNTSLKNAKSSFRGMLIYLPVSIVTTAVSVMFCMLFVAKDNLILPIIMWALLLGIGTAFAILSFKFLKERGAIAFESLE